MPCAIVIEVLGVNSDVLPKPDVGERAGFDCFDDVPRRDLQAFRRLLDRKQL
jgi:hypothetical protein